MLRSGVRRRGVYHHRHADFFVRSRQLQHGDADGLDWLRAPGVEAAARARARVCREAANIIWLSTQTRVLARAQNSSPRGVSKPPPRLSESLTPSATPRLVVVWRREGFYAAFNDRRTSATLLVLGVVLLCLSVTAARQQQRPPSQFVSSCSCPPVEYGRCSPRLSFYAWSRPAAGFAAGLAEL